MPSLMDKMNETDTQNDMKASLSSMFNKKPSSNSVSAFTPVAEEVVAPVAPAAPKAEKKVVVEEEKKEVQVGRPVYKYANGRKLRQVTTKLCEDNIEWICKYAESIGIHSGQISYTLNQLIEEKRGISEILKKNS